MLLIVLKDLADTVISFFYNPLSKVTLTSPYSHIHLFIYTIKMKTTLFTILNTFRFFFLSFFLISGIFTNITYRPPMLFSYKLDILWVHIKNTRKIKKRFCATVILNLQMQGKISRMYFEDSEQNYCNYKC